MNDLHMIMPDYATRRDAFDALLKPKVPYDDDFYLSWEKPERFTCDCCGFPTIMEPSRYEMCSLCEWEEENYPLDTNYDGGPNGNYMLFDARKNFEQYGCMYLPEKGYTDFERNTAAPVMVAKRKLIQGCLDLLKLQKGTSKLHTAWEQVLRDEIELINTKQNSHITYEELYEKLRYRQYPVAICKDNDWGYQAIVPDFPDFSPDSGLSEKHAIIQVKRKIKLHLLELTSNGNPIPEPNPLQFYQNQGRFKHHTWLTLIMNHMRVA